MQLRVVVREGEGSLLGDDADPGLSKKCPEKGIEGVGFVFEGLRPLQGGQWHVRACFARCFGLQAPRVSESC